MYSQAPTCYWWVNHKQTCKEELDGGYIWSPKKNTNKSKNQTYTNLSKTSAGDVVFSYAGTFIRAIGFVTEGPTTAGRPKSIKYIGPNWNDEGWIVRINWTRLHTPIKPKDYISIIAHLLPLKYSPISPHGDGLQSCYLAQISHELFLTLQQIILNKNPDLPVLAHEIERRNEEGILENQILKDSTLSSTEKDTLIKSRIGQGLFRYRVGEIEQRCRVTAVDDRRFLIASHIMPWSHCENNFQRLDGNNGLLLSPHIDKMFDCGWISFENDGDIIMANMEAENIIFTWNALRNFKKKPFNEKQKFYLKYHRSNILKRDLIK